MKRNIGPTQEPASFRDVKSLFQFLKKNNNTENKIQLLFIDLQGIKTPTEFLKRLNELSPASENVIVSEKKSLQTTENVHIGHQRKTNEFIERTRRFGIASV